MCPRFGRRLASSTTTIVKAVTVIAKLGPGASSGSQQRKLVDNRREGCCFSPLSPRCSENRAGEVEHLSLNCSDSALSLQKWQLLARRLPAASILQSSSSFLGVEILRVGFYNIIMERKYLVH